MHLMCRSATLARHLAMSSRSDAAGLLTLNDIRPYLTNAKQKGNQIIADCPLCGKKGHLYVTEKQSTLMVYCQKCNAPGVDILRAFRRLGAKPQPPEEKPKVDYSKIAPIEDYYHIYRNPDGSEAYRKRRKKWQDGHKAFGFEYIDSDGCKRYAKPDGCNNLYNLDKMAEAAPETLLYVVEGEKCADAMTAQGFLATTTNTGAQKNLKLSDTDKQYLEKFTTKIVIGDNDEKGADYVNAWQGAKVLPLADIWPECPRKGDVADYFEAGGAAEKIAGYEWPEEIKLDDEYIDGLDRKQLADERLMDAVYALNGAYEQQKLLTKLRIRANELGFQRNFDNLWKSYCQNQAAKGIRSDNMTKFPQQLFALRCGEWETGVDGVFRMVQQGNDFKKEYASPIPIMPTEILQNQEDGTEKIRLAYFKDGSWKSIVMPRSKIANKNKILDLADFGVEVNSDNAGQLVKYIANTVALNFDILPRAKSVDHMGWAGNDFVPYTDDIKLDCETEYKTLVDSIATSGTLEEWVDYIKPLRKNLYMRLILAASFASVLIAKVGALPFVLHLWGGTGSGKTVSMMVAASIWGNPAMGKMVRTMNMTVNSMMSTASVLHNLPFFGDELQTIKSRFENYDTLIMRVTEGVDRGRMSNTILQKQRSWLNSFVFTGEEPCTKSQSGGGVKNRVIEIECDQQIIKNGNAVVNFISKHYGCAGKAFIDGLHGMDLATDYNEVIRMVLEVTGTTEKQAMAMALMLQADGIASKVVFNDPGDVLDVRDVADFVKAKDEVDASERAFSIITDIIGANADKFDSVSTDFSGRAYWGRIQSDGEIFINKTVLEHQLEEIGFDFTALKKKWAEAGHLKKTTQGRFSNVYSINGVRANYVILVIEVGVS